MMEEIECFVVADDAKVCARLAAAKQRAHQRLLRQTRCMHEFINLNGRLYRYGFVSADPERTRDMAKQLSGGDLDVFHTMLHLPASTFNTWDEVEPASLQSALTDVVATPPPPPPPVVPPSVDHDTRQWLSCSVHASIKMLKLCRQDQREVVQVLDTMADGGGGATSPPPQDWGLVKDVVTTLSGFPQHGRVELAFATMAALSTTKGCVSAYAQMLKYIATTAHTNTFTPLPPGGDHTPPDALRVFLRNHDPDFTLPLAATTLPSLDMFTHLCRDIKSSRV